jgi:hypothetical protein
MATTCASRKQKGRRLAQRVAGFIRQVFNLSEDDVYNTPGGVPGEDIKLSEKARKLFGFSIECKNVEKLNIWEALEQAESSNRKYKPLVIFSRNRSEDFCALKFSDFMLLMEQIKLLTDEVNFLHEEKAGISI